MFLEVEYEKIDKVCGMDILIIISLKIKLEGYILFREFGIFFKNYEMFEKM